jgi:hypothetical protein
MAHRSRNQSRNESIVFHGGGRAWEVFAWPDLDPSAHVDQGADRGKLEPAGADSVGRNQQFVDCPQTAGESRITVAMRSPRRAVDAENESGAVL